MTATSKLGQQCTVGDCEIRQEFAELTLPPEATIWWTEEQPSHVVDCMTLGRVAASVPYGRLLSSPSPDPLPVRRHRLDQPHSTRFATARRYAPCRDGGLLSSVCPTGRPSRVVVPPRRWRPTPVCWWSHSSPDTADVGLPSASGGWTALLIAIGVAAAGPLGRHLGVPRPGSADAVSCGKANGGVSHAVWGCGGSEWRAMDEDGAGAASRPTGNRAAVGRAIRRYQYDTHKFCAANRFAARVARRPVGSAWLAPGRGPRDTRGGLAHRSASGRRRRRAPAGPLNTESAPCIRRLEY